MKQHSRSGHRPLQIGADGSHCQSQAGMKPGMPVWRQAVLRESAGNHRHP